MPLFSFTYLHPHTKRHCTVDSGKPTQMAAFIDIVQYMRRIGLRKPPRNRVLRSATSRCAPSAAATEN